MKKTGEYAALLCTVAGLAGCLAHTDAMNARKAVDWSRIPSPIILQGDSKTAFRDPTAIYHDGVFYLYFSVVERDPDGHYYWYTGMSKSCDLLEWTPAVKLTPKDQILNYSSPGNVIRYGGRWVICLQTYPTPDNEVHAKDTARIWIMRSDDLEKWDPAELLKVKGPDVPKEEMGRMIDPYLLEDKDEPGKWWCFYKQKGVSMSYSYDLSQWTYAGHTESGENVCLLIQNDEYVLFHSPSNGVGVIRSKDLKTWKHDEGLITLGQKDWPWAQGRLTAGFVLDLRNEPRVGKYIMFFHGSSKEGKEMWRSHGHATLGIAWSDDLEHWEWPR